MCRAFPHTLSQAVRKLLLRCPVLTVESAANPHHPSPARDEQLYERGKVTSRCTLVLSGHLRICAGADEVEIEAGPWSLLAQQSLDTDEYVPDYKAEVIGTARLLIISRDDYEEMLVHGEQLPRSSVRAASTELAAGAAVVAHATAAGFTAQRSSSVSPSSTRNVDWGATSQPANGTSFMLESGSTMPSCSRPNVFVSRSYDETNEHVTSQAGMSRSHSYPELVDDQGNAKPLVTLMDEAMRQGENAPLQMALFRPPTMNLHTLEERLSTGEPSP